MDSARLESLARVQERIGYWFKDVRLLDTALTHSSYVKGDCQKTAHHNERLEFLGDAVLELCISEYLYERYPGFDEGRMTRLRAATVYEQALFNASCRLGIGGALKLSRGEERSGGRGKPSILSNALEAVIGAVYLDGGLDKARGFVMSFSAKVIERSAKNAALKDYKTSLQEYVQKKRLGQVKYTLEGESGPEHRKAFLIGVYVNGELIGRGEGASKQEAGQRAARMALMHYGLIQENRA